MAIARRVGGFSPAQADDLRKAISKKNHQLMATLRDPLMEGLAASGVPPAVADKLWASFEATGDYSFNKSHAACYAMISYRTAWLKANYPVEYMAALVSSVMNTKDKVPFYVNQCREMGIEVLPPDVNESVVDFTVVGGKIRFGMNAVKGVGVGAIEEIIRARGDGGPFTGLYDFCARVDSAQANKRVLEALIRAGAFDGSGDPRRGMLEALPAAMADGDRRRKDAAQGQGGLFDFAAPEDVGAQAPQVPQREFDQATLLRGEKEALGLYVSAHPLQDLREQLREEIEVSGERARRRRRRRHGVDRRHRRQRPEEGQQERRRVAGVPPRGRGRRRGVPRLAGHLRAVQGPARGGLHRQGQGPHRAQVRGRDRPHRRRGGPVQRRQRVPAAHGDHRRRPRAAHGAGRPQEHPRRLPRQRARWCCRWSAAARRPGSAWATPCASTPSAACTPSSRPCWARAASGSAEAGGRAEDGGAGHGDPRGHARRGAARVGRPAGARGRAARPVRGLRVRPGHHAVAGVRGDVRGGRRRDAGRRLPAVRPAGPRARHAHRHDGARGAPRGHALRRRPPAAALLLRGAVHPAVGAAAQPGRRVRAGRGRAARAGLGRRRRRERSHCCATASPRSGCATSASRSGRWRSTARSSTRWGSTRTTARRSSRRSPTATTRSWRASPATRGVDERALGVLWKVLELSGSRDGLGPGAQARHHRRHGGRHPPHGGGPRPRGGGRLRRRRRVRLRHVSRPLVLQRRDLRGVRARASGLPIATGGRYDGLLARFDWDIPGVGFALALDRVLDAMAEAGVAPRRAHPPCWRSRAAWTSRRGRRSSAAPAGRGRPAGGRRRRRRRGCGARAVATCTRPPTARSEAGGWRDVRRVLGLE